MTAHYAGEYIPSRRSMAVCPGRSFRHPAPGRDSGMIGCDTWRATHASARSSEGDTRSGVWDFTAMMLFLILERESPEDHNGRHGKVAAVGEGQALSILPRLSQNIPRAVTGSRWFQNFMALRSGGPCPGGAAGCGRERGRAEWTD